MFSVPSSVTSARASLSLLLSRGGAASSGAAAAATAGFASSSSSSTEKTSHGGLLDSDRIFTNLYGRHDPGLKVRVCGRRFHEEEEYSYCARRRCRGGGGVFSMKYIYVYIHMRTRFLGCQSDGTGLRRYACARFFFLSRVSRTHTNTNNISRAR